jgi:ABC-type branched-subunit amino acid transport system ATPase component/ABC-type branched-subunit amino acid transport system permease subunit
MTPSQAASYLARRNGAFFFALLAYALLIAPLYFLRAIHSDVIVTSAIFFIVVLAMDLLYGCAGMLTFGHVGFFAVGAYSVAILFARSAISPLLGAFAGVLITIPLSYALGRICLRLAPSYFMLATLAFGIMVHAVITVWYGVTGGDGGLGGIPRPIIGGSLDNDLTFGTFAACCAIALFWLTYSLSRSRVGRALRAIRGDAVAASCLGINVDRLKTNTFVISACYASFAGSLFAMYNGAVHPDSFSLSTLLDLLLMMFLGGEGTLWGGLFGATIIRQLPDLFGGLHGGQVLFEGIFFCIVIFMLPRGIAGAVEDSLKGRVYRGTKGNVNFPYKAPPWAEQQPAQTPLLQVEHVARSFGGIRAIDDVSFAVRPGQIKGLIGPNGAGKSTLMNLITGVLSPDGGRISLHTTETNRLRPDETARLGIQRTFQHERLFPHLTIEENIMVGEDRGVTGGFAELLACALGSRRSLIAEVGARERAATWLQALQLEEYAHATTESVPQGLRKLVELARACAAQPVLLLLDETVAGLSDSEKQAVKALIKKLRIAGLTIIIIEHDIDFVLELCDDVCVIDFGRTIAEGPPAEIRKNEAVITAYLG